MPQLTPSKLRTEISRIAHGGITLAETEKLLAKVSKDGVTHSERRNLMLLSEARHDVFEKDAQRRMDAFFSGEADALFAGKSLTFGEEGVEAAMPKPMKKDAAIARAEWAAGKLWGSSGPKLSDISQGLIGDCYMLAAFTSAAAREGMVEKLLRDNGDGTFTATFQERPLGSFRYKPVEVTVDARLYVNKDGVPLYAGVKKDALWVAVLEKAFAQWQGNFQKVGMGSENGFALSALTGRVSTTDSLWGRKDHDRVFAKVKKALDEGRLVMAGTYADEDRERYPGSGLISCHAYAVLSTREEGGKQYVTLRNPWAEVEPTGNGRNDGVFELDSERFLELIGTVSIS